MLCGIDILLQNIPHIENEGFIVARLLSDDKITRGYLGCLNWASGIVSFLEIPFLLGFVLRVSISVMH